MMAYLPPNEAGTSRESNPLRSHGPSCGKHPHFGRTSPGARALAMGQFLADQLPNRRNAFAFRHLSLMAWTTLLLWLGTASLGRAQVAPLVDLSVSKTIDNKLPALGSTIKYTVTVRNSSTNPATGVVVMDQLPVGGVSFLSSTIVRGTGSFTSGTGVWNVGALAANDSAVLEIQAKVLSPGVWFNKAFVMQQNQGDEDSLPGNEIITEDDYANACFAVPVMLYPDEEITVKIPTGYQNIVWMKDGVTVTNSDTTLVKINADSSLTIRTPGTYTFTNTVGNCPSGGCCPILVLPGQYGKLGDFVWLDKNSDGLQGNIANEPGIQNVRVYLYDSTGTTKLDSTLTNVNGFYEFDSLRDGKYKVQFVKPTGFDLTISNVPGDDTKDSDAGSNGFTHAVTIDVSRLLSDTLRVNPNIDAGLVPRLGSIGDYVWSDTDKDGIQDAGETGINGLKVYLQRETTPGVYAVVDSTVTSGNGGYLFDSLPSGNYKVQFTKPGGTVFTLANVGGNDTKDSDVGSAGLSHIVRIDVTKAPGDTLRNNPQIDAGLVPDCVKPILLAMSDQTICQGDTVSLTSYAVSNSGGTSTGITYQWYAFTATTATVGALIPGATGNSFRPNGAQLPPANGTIYYYAVIGKRGTDATCADTAYVAITVKPTPVAPEVTSNGTICAGDSVSLIATSPGNTINIYTTINGTTPIATITSGQAFVVVPDSTTTYYVEAVSPGEPGCASPRTSVRVVVNPKPATPIYVDLANVCPDSTVNLNVALRQYQASTVGGVFEFRVGPLSSSAIVTDSLVKQSKSLYLFEKSAAGCYSDPKLVNITITPCGCQLVVTVTIAAPGEICSGSTINATATVTTSGPALTGTWTSLGTGSFSSTSSYATTYTPSAIDSLNGSVTLKFTTIDPDGSGPCVPVSESVLVKINPTPVPPFNVSCADSVICKGTSTKLFGFSTTGATIKWYTAAVGGTLVGTAMNGGFITVSPTQTTTYYAEASIGNCVNPQRTPLTVNVKECNLIDLSLTKIVSQANPALGDTITYTIEAQNGGPSTATGVEIRDLLPAGIEFVSSATLTKVGNELVGTIASLPTGDFRRFSFRAKVTGSGTITNRAQVTKANEQDKDSTPDNGYTNAEDDNDFVDITVRQPCVPVPPVVTCGKATICPGECVVLTANGCNGTVTWSTGATGATLTVCPIYTTTYTATCTINGCTSAKSNGETITVTSPAAPYIAANTTTVCNGGSATLTATGCANGTITWSNGQVGASITVSPTSPTTYSAVCKVGTCTSVASNLITINVANPSAPIIGCTNTDICPGGSTTLTAFGCEGTVVWSDGQMGASITVSPLVSTEYFAKCKIGECTSAKSNVIKVNVLAGAAPVITASSTSLCSGGSVTLTATGCSGGVLWSNGQSGYIITVTQAGTYTAKCIGVGCTSGPSNPIVITPGNAPTPPIVTCGKMEICVGECVTLLAGGCANGTVTWSTGATGQSLVVCPTETTGYSATCTINGCTSAKSNIDTIIVNKPATPTITASKTTITQGESSTLTASGCNGIVIWSNGQVGASITVSPATDQSYSATCKVGDCVSGSSIVIKIKVKVDECPVIQPPVVTCGKMTICLGESEVLTAHGCNGTVVWSNGATGNSITVTPNATTTYTAKCKVGNCFSAVSNAEVIMVIVPVTPIVTANKTSVSLGDSVTLTATGCNGTVIWSNGAVGASIVVTPTQTTTTYTAKCVVGRCTSPASNTIIVTVTRPDCQYPPAAPVITASEDTITLGESVTLTATGCNGTVIWSNGETGNSITVSPIVNTTYSAQCKVGNCISVACKPIKVIIRENPCANIMAPVIQPDKTTICGVGSATLMAYGCEGGVIIWSDPSHTTGGTLVVSPTITTTYYATCTIGNCTSGNSNAATVFVDKPATPVLACGQFNVCPGESVTLYAAGCIGGTYEWNDGFIGAIHTVTPNSTTSYTARCVVDSCKSDPSQPLTITVGKPNAPVLSASITEACAGQLVSLTATGCEGTVKWSTGMTGMAINVSPIVTTTYSAICRSGNENCLSDTARITIHVGPIVPKPVCKPVVNTCPDSTVNLNDAVIHGGGRTLEFHVSTDPASALVANPTAVSTSGVYYAFVRNENGCYSEYSIISVLITKCPTPTDCATNPATADAGADVNVCPVQFIKLAGKIGGAASYATWTTNGTGQFDNQLKLDATYQVSLEDIIKGSVKLILTTCDPDSTGPCLAASDTLILTIKGIKFVPTVTVVGSTALCFGDSVVLTAQPGYRYKWRKNGVTVATTQSFVVREAGEYTVQLIDEDNCCSIDSEPVIVTMKEAMPALAVINPTNVCPALTVDLTMAVGDNGSVEFRMDNNPDSPLIANPNAVPGGTYYAFLKSNEGCYSAPATIIATVVACDSTITGPAIDLSLTKTASATQVSEGDTVTYTLAVTNHGTIPATNVLVTDVLPEGLELVSTDPAAVVSGDSITFWHGVLPAGASGSFTIKALVTGSGPIANIASVKADQPDSLMQNNVDAATIDADTAVAGPHLGVALAITDTTKQLDGSYNITYLVTVKNLGDAPLANISLSDSLTNTFGALPFTVVGKPSVVSGTALMPDTTYDGSLQTTLATSVMGTLGVGESAALSFTVNVLFPDSLNGPFYNAVYGVATTLDSSVSVSDWSNSGLEPQLGNDTPTPLVFGLPATRMGIAKTVLGEPVKLADHVYELTYEIRATNYGGTDLEKVSITDDLGMALLDKGATLSAMEISTDAGFTFDTTYTGVGLHTSVLVDSLSTLPAGATRWVRIKVQVDLSAATDSVFHNTAIGKGWAADNSISEDASTQGLNADPDNDLDPANNSVPTDVTLGINALQPRASIGLAMQADTVQQANGSYNVTYTLVVKNYSGQELTKVQIADSLTHTFDGATGYTLVSAPTVNATATVVPNPAFNGRDKADILIAESSKLGVGKADTIRFTINVVTDGRTEPFFNTALATALFGDSVRVSDYSTTGLDPASNGLPATFNEPTPVTLPGLGDVVFVPEGFSPNGDGINDLFKIRNTKGAGINVQIFNRWGNLVYSSEDYQNDWGGKANRGSVVGSDGLPDGTYYYVIKLSDGRSFTRFMTIMR